MSLGDAVQIVTIVAFATGFYLSLWQGRQMIQQTRAMSDQLFDHVADWIVQTHTEQRTSFFLHDDELLAWHLESRGYRSTTPLENKQRLYALVKFDTHESVHLRYKRGAISKPLWLAWRQVLVTDMTVPIFPDVWENGRKFYEESFGREVDAILAAQRREHGDH
jgi:hypothetical protein